MRAVSWARGATCVLAVSICVPAFAERTKSLASCTSFDQEEKGDAKVAFTVRNSCTIPVDCAVSWRVICAPDSKKRRAEHPGSAKLALVAGTGSDSAEADASICGDASWTIDQVRWSCQPNKD